MFISAGDNHRIAITPLTADFTTICVFYGFDCDVEQDLVNAGFQVIAGSGSKFQNLWTVIQSRPGLLDNFDAVLVLDDDLAFDNSDVSALFDIREAHDLAILGPTMDPRGRNSYPISRQRLRTKLRFTNFIEMGAPLFRAEALARFMDVYDPQLISYGTDFWYHHVIGSSRKLEFAISDEIACLNPWGRETSTPREIDLAGSQLEREAAWERMAEAFSIERIEPIVLLEVPRRLRYQARMLPRYLGLRSIAFSLNCRRRAVHLWLDCRRLGVLPKLRLLLKSRLGAVAPY